jgi:hypothetical protein
MLCDRRLLVLCEKYYDQFGFAGCCFRARFWVDEKMGPKKIMDDPSDRYSVVFRHVSFVFERIWPSEVHPAIGAGNLGAADLGATYCRRSRARDPGLAPTRPRYTASQCA